MIRKLPFLILLVAAGCGGDPVGLTPAQQVYEFIMNKRLQDPLSEVIILKDTQAFALIGEDVGSLSIIIEDSGNVPERLMERLIASAQESKPLDWTPVMVNAKFVALADILGDESGLSLEVWTDFSSMFPDHSEFYALSDVVFNEDYSEAALVVSYYCPVMCGSGEFLVYLAKSDAQWRILGSAAFWIT